MPNPCPTATLPEQLRASRAIAELFRSQARQCLETAARIDHAYRGVAEMLRAASRDYDAQAERIEATLASSQDIDTPQMLH